MSNQGEVYFRYHVFFCCNQRAEGQLCCQNHRADGVREYAKQQIKALGLAGRGAVRINSAGCLDRCDQGPVLVVYPEGIWYCFVDEADIDEIIVEHLQQGRIVERLRI